MSELHYPTIAILASGGGSTAEALIHATQDDRLDAEVGLVICNNPPEKAAVWERIAQLNKRYILDIPIVMINSATHPDPEGSPPTRGQTLAESAAICDLIAKGNFSLVALLGYMKVVRGYLQEEYGWHPDYASVFEARMLNTHPGPLPETADTYGLGASKRVLELGLASSKHTVHAVGAGVDQGPIIAEHAVDIMPDDTPQRLFERVQIVEKTALPYTIGKFLNDQARHYANI